MRSKLLSHYVYQALRGVAPRYIHQFVRVADVPCIGGASGLFVSAVKRSTIGCRSFRVDGSQMWNSLPTDITSSSSLSLFLGKHKKLVCLNSHIDLDF
jgi:hypothetical protein